MKIAYIWYEPDERDLVENRIKEERPDWNLNCIPEHTTCNLNSVLRLLNDEYNVVLVHLSLRYCLALKMAEVSHSENSPTKIILFSRTVADSKAISGFFDGHINPDRHINNLTRRIESIVHTQRTPIEDKKEIDRRILKIFNSSDTLKASYLAKFKIRHKHKFTLEDYRRAILASSKPDWDQPVQGQAENVFISYSHADRSVASELARLLKDAGISCFLAERDIDGGDKWEEMIRQELFSAQEVLLLLTPNSINSKWVMIEAGAAWSLGRRITPCLAYVDLTMIPEPISKHQARYMTTDQEKRMLVEEIRKRILVGSG